MGEFVLPPHTQFYTPRSRFRGRRVEALESLTVEPIIIDNHQAQGGPDKSHPHPAWELLRRTKVFKEGTGIFFLKKGEHIYCELPQGVEPPLIAAKLW